MSDERTVRTPKLAKALKALQDSTVSHEDNCTCSGCKGVRTIDQILGREDK